MFCNKCGNRIPDDAGFCNKCGTKVASGEHKQSASSSAPIFNNEGTKKTKSFILLSSTIPRIAIIVIIVIAAIGLLARCFDGGQSSKSTNRVISVGVQKELLDASIEIKSYKIVPTRVVTTDYNYLGAVQ